MSTDFTKPVVGDAYATLLPGIVTAINDLARGLEPTLTGTSTNVPTGAIRWNAATSLWERYNGSSWPALAATYGINISGSAGSATTATNLAGGAAGGVPYQTGAGATAQLGAGISGQVLTSGGSGAPTWISQSSLVAGSASAVAWTSVSGRPTALSGFTNDLGNYGGWITSGGTSAACSGNAATATSLAGGSAGTIPYQSAAGTTQQLAAGTSGYFLKSGGAGAPSWAAAPAIVYTTQTTPILGTGVSYVVTHGMGAIPSSVTLQLVCLTAEQGYSVGDVIEEARVWNGSVAVIVMTWKNATQCGTNIPSGTGIFITNKSTAVAVALTPANWAYRYACRIG